MSQPKFLRLYVEIDKSDSDLQAKTCVLYVQPDSPNTIKPFVLCDLPQKRTRRKAEKLFAEHCMRVGFSKMEMEGIFY